MRLVSDVSNELRMDDDAAGSIHSDTLRLQHTNFLWSGLIGENLLLYVAK